MASLGSSAGEQEQESKTGELPQYPPAGLSGVQGKLFSSCSALRTLLMEETWRCQGIERGDGNQAKSSTESISPVFLTPSVPVHAS